MNDVEAVGHYDQADTRLARERSYHAFNLACIVNGICARLDSKRSRRGLQRSLVIAGDKRGRLRIEQKCEPRNARRHFLKHFHPFAHHRRFVSGEPGNVSTRMGQVGDEAGADWIGNLNEHDWNGAGFFLERGDCWGHVTNNYVRSQCDQRLREGLDPGGIAGGPAMIKSKVAALHPSQFLARLMERLHRRLRFQIAVGKVRQHANSAHALALRRARRERPCRRAAEQRDELAPLYPNHVIPRACAVWVRLKRTLAALAHFARCLGRRPFAASGGRRDDRLSGLSPIRHRAEVEAGREALLDIIEASRPMTVRQVFYQATVRGLVEKAESGYGKVQTDLTVMRRAGELPYDWLADNTRWQRKPRTFDSVEDALRATAAFYRKSLWTDADAYVEIWLEKDALAGVVYPVTSMYDVPLMVARGYASLSFLYSAAEAINELVVPAYIYHLGDFDPSGVNPGEKIEETLRELPPAADIYFERLAVTEQQIAEW